MIAGPAPSGAACPGDRLAIGRRRTTLSRLLLQTAAVRPSPSRDDARARPSRSTASTTTSSTAAASSRCTSTASSSNGPRCIATSTARRAIPSTAPSRPAATCCSTSTSKAPCRLPGDPARHRQRVHPAASIDELMERLRRRAEDDGPPSSGGSPRRPRKSRIGRISTMLVDDDLDGLHGLRPSWRPSACAAGAPRRRQARWRRGSWRTSPRRWRMGTACEAVGPRLIK